ncbi:MAG: hypothetical protein H0U66_11215 [Gemmatimonadaceae bacterium]|nr:hypothetical protein [Gemmatimonadaceae bacterium]
MATTDIISRDFDFLHGRWRVRNRRLLRPLTGSNEWAEFEGTSVVRAVWDGQGCLEEWEGDAPTGHISAVSLHLWDPRAHQWSMHWATRADGKLGVPTVGCFANGRGDFFAHEDFEGRAIFLRLRWEPRGANACRFEQAFSTDGGATWETNWQMEFTRAANADVFAMRAPVRAREGACDFDYLHGSWRVHNRRLRASLALATEWYEFDGDVTESAFWDGDGNLEEYDAVLPDGVRLRGLALRLYEPDAQRWTIRWASDATGTLDPPMTGAFIDGRGAFYSQERYDGRMIFVRFLWTHRGERSARWEQSFSIDGGKTWEMNWIMDFSRTGT